MSEKEQEWFIAERSRALAMIHLMRREDLVISPAGSETGLQYLVRIKKPGEERSFRQFGLVLGGSKSSADEKQLNRILRPVVQALTRIEEFPYPVCLFHFTMDDDQGYFTWVAEPATEEGMPRLLIHTEARCRKLDRESLGEIVAAVDRWYDAFFGRIAVKAS